MVANIYNEVEFTSLQNLFVTLTKLFLRLSNLIELAIDNPLIDIYIYIHSIKQSVSKKKAALARGSFSRRSSNIATKMNFVVAFLHLPLYFQRIHVLPVVKKRFRSFFSLFFYLILNSTFCKCNAYRYISFDTFKTFFFSRFLLINNNSFINKCFLSAFSSV